MAGLTRASLISFAIILSATSMAAATERPQGCYTRTYDAVHMRGHRSQQIRRLWIRLEDSRNEPGKTDFGMGIWVRGKPQRWSAGGRCEPDAKGWKCQPDTDGASALMVTLKGLGIQLSNPGKLKISDDVTGPDLNDMDVSGVDDSLFLLRPARDAVCRDTAS